MATAGGPNPPPLHVIEEHGLTEISVHCDVALSEAQLGRINSSLHEAGIPAVGNRKRQLRWATPGEGGGFWEFRIELYTLSERSGESPSMHVMMVGDKVVRREPSAHMRSLRTVEKIRTLVGTLFQEQLAAEFDCSMTWHSSPDSSILPRVLPLTPDFPEESPIQEISGVIGGSADGEVSFLVDKVGTNPMTFHIWLAFKRDLTLSQKVMTEAINQGISMLENINLWEK